MKLQPGAVICDRLEIDCALDEAGAPVFAPAYACKDTQTGQDLWIAAIDRRLLPSSGDVSKFMAGANDLAGVRHPTLVRVVLVDREPELCVVAYEWLPDVRSVASLLDAGKPVDASRLARDTARGLAFLHKQGLVHGMLSADTVLQWEDTFALWQYGLASLCQPLAVVQRCRRLPDQVFAPEYVRGDPLTPVADVHAWGVLVARLGTGSDAVEAANAVLHAIGDPDLPAGLLEVAKAALDPSPDRRPRDGVHLRTMVEEALRPRRRSATPAPASAAAPKPPPKPPPPEQDESGILLETGDIQLVDLDGDGSAPSERSAASRNTAPKASADPTPTQEHDLVALAGEHAGEKDIVVVPGGGLPVMDDALDMAIRDVKKSAPAALGAPFPGQDPIGSEAAALEIPEGVLELPRTPGPHGPRALVMTGWLLLIMLSVVGLVGWRVAVQAGGFFALLGFDPLASSVRAEEPVVSSTGDGTGTDGMRDGSGEGEATETGVPKLDVPGAEDLHVACPKGAVPLDEKRCIDAAEYPRLMRIPHVGVSHRDAATACENRQGRLCTLKEWQRACYGPKRARYSYGQVFEPNRCNTASVAGFPQEVGLAGAYQGCVSAIGTYDMVGNVGEWVAEGIAAGGDSTTTGRIASCAAKGRPPPGYAGPDLGFRCCFDLFE